MFSQDRTHITSSSRGKIYQQGCCPRHSTPASYSHAPISEEPQVLVAEAGSDTSLRKPGRLPRSTSGELVAGGRVHG
ncbi:hypothetical protein MTO96_049458 [Rhipicephalus appendiculatus]